MKVSDLIEQLKKFSPDEEVFLGVEGYVSDNDYPDSIRVQEGNEGGVYITDTCYYGMYVD